ncbi:MAG TPA: DUF5996 family protein [Terriglobia bacterium]
MSALDPQPDVHAWPALPLSEWRETCATLHMWTQIVGKVRLALSPYWNHWWQSTLYVSARGLTTSPIPYEQGVFEIEFDFMDHALRIQTSQGETRTLALTPRSVVSFYHEIMGTLESLRIQIHIWPVPVEIPDPIPFEKDQVHASYDPEYAHRFWRVLMSVDKVFKQFRGGFIGKCSPVHFFWGSFDLAVTRFSGRRAPERPGADPITREAYSHEVISAGFWPGGGVIPDAAFYCYAAPEPPGFRESVVRPEAAFYSPALSEFFLMYDEVAKADSPEARLLEFLESTYQTGAVLGNWDRQALERAST